MLKIDPEGYTFSALCIVCAAAVFVLYAVTGSLAALVTGVCAFLAAVLVVNFFRDPERLGPTDTRAVISAADGVVMDVRAVDAEGFSGGRALRIAVFMNVFNVHVNRAPVAGKVCGTVHRPGRKLSAFNRRAEYENEHGDTDIETPAGIVRVRQIAGIIARRVVTRVRSGEVLERGQRIGIIRFGSRVDVFLPVSFKPAVKKGDHVRAGETIIALSG